MPTAKPGKTKWRKLLQAGFVATEEQFKRNSQLHANLTRLLIENQDNGQAAAVFAQMIAQLDLNTEQIFEHQRIYTELWRISMGSEPEELAPHDTEGDTQPE
jgi:hypothetical protein